jgi:hypothetical protein
MPCVAMTVMMTGTAWIIVLQKFGTARSLMNRGSIPSSMATTWKAREPAIAALAPASRHPRPVAHRLAGD